MTKDKATATPQLVHSARQMFETRLAKYNDPHNLEWDFDDIRDKWERHAFSAFVDLQTVEAERDQLLAEVAQLREAARDALVNLEDCHVDENLFRLGLIGKQEVEGARHVLRATLSSGKE